MLQTNWPDGRDPRWGANVGKVKRAKRGKVGRSYSKLGDFTPRIWGPSEGARDARSHGAERIATPHGTIVAFPAPRSPDKGERIQAGIVIRREGATLIQWRTLADRSIMVDCPTPVCTVGGGASVDAVASIAPTLDDPTIRYAHDGDVQIVRKELTDIHDNKHKVRARLFRDPSAF